MDLMKIAKSVKNYVAQIEQYRDAYERGDILVMEKTYLKMVKDYGKEVADDTLKNAIN